jgi:protein-S-isoprenylcysteine O-methyltransferase Ste14
MGVADALVAAAWAGIVVDNLLLARAQRAARAALGPPVVGGHAAGPVARTLLLATLLGGAAVLERLTGGPVRPSAAVTAAGLMLVALGAGLHVAARRRLGPQWASDVTVLAGHELIVAGPYAVVRHPLYLAVSLMALGTVLVRPSAATVCLTAGLFGGVALKIGAEEHALRAVLGDRHTAYVARVPAIVPRPRALWVALRKALSGRARR